MTTYKKLISDLSSIVSNVNRVQDYIDDLIKQNNALRLPKSIMELFPYEHIKFPERRYDSYTGRYYESYETVEECDNLIKQLNENHAIMMDRKEKNADIIKNNTEVYNNAVKFMETLGFKTTYGTWHGSGKRKKYAFLPSAWYTSLNEQIPTNDGWHNYESTYKTRMETVQKQKESIIKQKEEKEKQDQIIKETKEKEFELAKLKVKYNLDAEADVSDLFDMIISKNKYLYLAYHLEMNRNDWNDGYDYAETGLSKFNIDSDLDQKIYDNITYQFIDFNDGRVFRDCEYNYSVLYGIVKQQDQELYNDYEKAFTLLNFFNPRY